MNSEPYFVSQQSSPRPYLTCTSSVNMPTNVTVDSIETGPRLRSGRPQRSNRAGSAEPAPRSRSQERYQPCHRHACRQPAFADPAICRPLGDPTVVTSLYTPRHGNSAQLRIKRPIQTFRLRAAKSFPLKVVACLHLIQIANPAFACREGAIGVSVHRIAHNVLQLTHTLPAHIEHAFLIVVRI